MSVYLSTYLFTDIFISQSAYIYVCLYPHQRRLTLLVDTLFYRMCEKTATRRDFTYEKLTPQTHAVTTSQWRTSEAQTVIQCV
jgi:hypothetical protein